MTNIVQIFISDDEAQPLPPYFQMAVNSVKSGIPHSKHHIYSHQELREWIEKEYGSTVRLAFDKLIPYAFKADLARYLLLYKLGGWYFDISVRVINGSAAADYVDFITFAEQPLYSKTSYACNNAIIYAKANSPILEETINEVLKNIATENYGRSVLYPTGPACLGKFVAKYFEALYVYAGTFTDLTPAYPNKNRGFLLDDGTLFALHKNGNVGGDLTAFGAKGTNNYGLLYAERSIYNPNIQLNMPLTL